MARNDEIFDLKVWVLHKPTHHDQAPAMSLAHVQQNNDQMRNVGLAANAARVMMQQSESYVVYQQRDMCPAMAELYK